MNKIIIAFAAGIAIGVLIAPARGATSRAKLQNGFNGLANKIDKKKKKKMYQNALDTIGEHIGAV